MRPYSLKVGPKSNHWVCKRREENTQRNRQIPCEDGGRDWSNAATNEGQLRIAQSLQELEEASKGFCRAYSEGTWPWQNFDFRLLALRSMRE